MHELVAQIERWLAGGEEVALATVVGVRGSSPRPAGARLAVTRSGRMAGAVAPFTIGAVATLPGIGIGLALATTSAFFLLAAGLIFALPDRSGQELEV